jgi:hypothetical protein
MMAKKRLPARKVSKRCSRSTFEGMLEGFPNFLGQAQLAWECWRRMTVGQQLAVMKSMDESEGDSDWIEEKLREAKARL